MSKEDPKIVPAYTANGEYERVFIELAIHVACVMKQYYAYFDDALYTVEQEWKIKIVDIQEMRFHTEKALAMDDPTLYCFDHRRMSSFHGIARGYKELKMRPKEEDKPKEEEGTDDYSHIMI